MNWRIIKNFGQIKYFNISYGVIIIVPLLANTFHMLNEKYNYDISLPETVKYVYTASLIYAIAIVIYQFFCPQIIMEYHNIQDFIDKNLKQFENKLPDKKLEIVLAHLDKETQKSTRDEIISLYRIDTIGFTLEQKINQNNQLNEKLKEVYSSCIQSHLTKKYNNENKKYPILYWFSGALYILGTIIIIYLLIIRTYTVYTN